MAKKSNERLEATVDSLRPYVERALKDDDFRDHVREALTTARGIYGDLSKEQRDRQVRPQAGDGQGSAGEPPPRARRAGRRRRPRPDQGEEGPARRVTRRCWSRASSWAPSTTRGPGRRRATGCSRRSPATTSSRHSISRDRTRRPGGRDGRCERRRERRGLAPSTSLPAVGRALSGAAAVQGSLKPPGHQPARL